MKNLRYAFKLLTRTKVNNLTRLISITLGLFIGIVIFSYATYLMSFDRFFPDSERVYQLRYTYSTPTSSGDNHLCFEPMAPMMEAEFPQIEAASRIFEGMQWVEYDYQNQDWQTKHLYVDSAFFDVLDFGIISGDPRKIFVTDANVMISESFARKVFKDEDPIGKVFDLGVKDREPKIVCGVFKDPPFNNHLGQFNMLRSITAIEDRLGDSWTEKDRFPTYIKLREGAEPVQVEEQMDAFLARHNEKGAIDEMNREYYLSPIALAKTHGDIMFGETLILIILGILALFVSSLNYILISLSMLIKRSKTIGMLKCNGASKRAIFSISLFETAIIILGSVGLAAIIIYALRMPFEQLMMIPSVELFALKRMWSPFCLVLLTFIVIGLIDGRLFSKVPISAAFRENVYGNMKWKKTLLFSQILISTLVLTMLILVVKQVDYLKNVDRGYDLKTLLYTFSVGTESEFDYYKNQIEAIDGVMSVGLSQSLPVYGHYGRPCYDEETKELLFNCRREEVGYDYLPTMGLEILYGSNFIREGIPNQVIVNHKYLTRRGWGEDAVGKQIIEIKEKVVSHFTIVGVTKNSLMGEWGYVTPSVTHLVDYDAPRELYMMISCSEITPELLKVLYDKMGELFPEENPGVASLDAVLLDRLEYDIAFRDGIMLISSIIVLICLMGLIGFLNDEINRRSKEIAIRKVAGAEFKDILILIASKMARVALPAIAIGLIGLYFAGGAWLQMYPNRIPFSWWIFALGGLFILLIVFGTQIIRSWSIARENPIKRIKTE